jgi:chromate reductase
MAEKINIIGFSGSLRSGSFNTAALRAAQQLCPDDAEIDIFDISDFEPFNQDRDQDPPKNVTKLKASIRASDAVLFSSPEYNYSVPGHLKNVIDWASRPYGDSAWDGKPALIMGASPGAVGTARMQYHLRQMMVFLNMFPLNRPEVMISNCAEKFDANGNLTDEATKDHIHKALTALIEETRRRKQSG